jgi:hypothetical protein
MTSLHHYYLRKGGGEGKKIRLGKVEPNRCSFRKVPMFSLQQNKQTAELEREPNCSIILQLAVINVLGAFMVAIFDPFLIHFLFVFVDIEHQK